MASKARPKGQQGGDDRRISGSNRDWTGRLDIFRRYFCKLFEVLGKHVSQLPRLLIVR